jgi:hypothetical protein
MRYKQKSFTVPVATPRKVPCAVHHFDGKGKCFRCDEVAKKRADELAVTDGRTE